MANRTTFRCLPVVIMRAGASGRDQVMVTTVLLWICLLSMLGLMVVTPTRRRLRQRERTLLLRQGRRMGRISAWRRQSM